MALLPFLVMAGFVLYWACALVYWVGHAVWRRLRLAFGGIPEYGVDYGCEW